MTPEEIPEAPDRPVMIRRMFRSISNRYDLMNRLITWGMDASWRRRVVQRAAVPEGGRLLDVGTGTGAIALLAARTRPDVKVTGADFTLSMMEIGRQRPFARRICWCCSDALSLPFTDATFDAVTSGYLVRNVGDVPAAFREQMRVVKPGGRVVCLETSPPPSHTLRPLILWYLERGIPFLGRVIAGNPSAYRYLPATTRAFYTPRRLAAVMKGAGLCDVTCRPFMFGTQVICTGRRPHRVT
ncbi:MAG: ubiquinone/menaquinone biosynthesis methyltransferase [Deltaproteobacteria bacterium]|nr:ubiquinone/menaquinone biosynthesis methyltransferase [Deltaproteobacteria bacterium]